MTYVDRSVVALRAMHKGLHFWVLLLTGHIAGMGAMCSGCLSTPWSILPCLRADGDFLTAAAAEVMSQIWRHRTTLPAAAQGGLLGSLQRLSWPETFFSNPHMGAVLERRPSLRDMCPFIDVCYHPKYDVLLHGSPMRLLLTCLPPDRCPLRCCLLAGLLAAAGQLSHALIGVAAHL